MNEKNELLEHKLGEMGLNRAVISFCDPETREHVRELWRSEPHSLYDPSYLQKQSGLHHQFKHAWLAWAQPLVRLEESQIPYFYRCQGSRPLMTTGFISLSKVFGVYYHRIGGVFHKEVALSLIGPPERPRHEESKAFDDRN